MRKLLTGCMVLLLILLLAVPVFAAGSSTPYVMDEASLLTQQQRESLNDYAESITKTFGIGIYLMTVEDFHDYGDESQIFDVLWNYYHYHRLGYGQDREGMILILSMEGRDYATYFYGENTAYVFSDHAQVQLEEDFLDYFRNDDWYGGFLAYLSCSEDFMARAAAGDPVRESPTGHVALFIFIAVCIAAIITWVKWRQMANVSVQKGASHYQIGEGLVLTHKKDIFLHQSVIRRKIERSNSDSGSSSRSHSASRSGGGGRGRSGKF